MMKRLLRLTRRCNWNPPPGGGCLCGGCRCKCGRGVGIMRGLLRWLPGRCSMQGLTNGWSCCIGEVWMVCGGYGEWGWGGDCVDIVVVCLCCASRLFGSYSTHAHTFFTFFCTTPHAQHHHPCTPPFVHTGVCNHALGHHASAIADYNACFQTAHDGVAPDIITLQVVSFYLKELALYTHAHLDTPVDSFCYDRDIHPVFKVWGRGGYTMCPCLLLFFMVYAVRMHVLIIDNTQCTCSLIHNTHKPTNTKSSPLDYPPTTTTTTIPPPRKCGAKRPPPTNPSSPSTPLLPSHNSPHTPRPAPRPHPHPSPCCSPCWTRQMPWAGCCSTGTRDLW